MFLLSYCTAFGMTLSLVQCGPVLKSTDNSVPMDFNRLYCSGFPAYVDKLASAFSMAKNDDQRHITKRYSPRGTPRALDVAEIVSQIRSRVVARSTDDRKVTGWPPTSLIDAIAQTLRRGISTGNGDDEECVERIVSLVREALQARRNVEYENTASTKCHSTAKCQPTTKFQSSKKCLPKTKYPLTTATTNAMTTYYTSCTSTTTTRKGTGSMTTKATITSTASISEPMELTEFGFENIQPNLVDLVNGYMV